jgi:SAM-dependent methyltransferase
LNVASRLTTSCQIAQYKEAINKYASGHLIDMGCGDVPYYRMYRPLVQKITCVDWPNSRHKNKHLDVAANLNSPLPFASESFDTVLLTDVLEHIFRPAELVSEIARILRFGGKAIMGVPFLYWLHEQPYDFYRYTEFALRQMCEDAQLTILRLLPYGGAPEVLADIAGKCLPRGLRSICGVYIAAASAVLGWRPFRYVSNRTARQFPLGYVVVADRN